MNSDIAASREVRVFLSSTFADMQAERDYLVKKIFPAVRSEFRRRNVDLTVLDLRWGITEEESKSGKVIEICMDEISRTRPFFIGLIGGRYGWVPTAAESNFDERLYNRFPHVREGLAQGKSITEMEMLYGVLDYPEQTYSHFFIRPLRSVPKKFLDKKGSANAEKREKLKAAVRKAAAEGKCSVADYTSLKQLGKMVTEALMTTLDTLYPAEEEMSRMDLIMSNHDAAVARLRKIYVPRTTSVNESLIDDDDEKVIILEAPAGAGKSTFVANYWRKGVAQSSAGTKYIAVHTMIGNEINSAEMCRRALVYELCRNFSELETPDLNIPDEQKVNVAPILKKLSEEYNVRLLWILDGVDKLRNKTDRNLLWLNDILDEERKVLLLGSDEEQFDDFTSGRDDYSHNDLVPLSESQKMSLTAAYLRNFAKGLTVSQRAAIANDRKLGNPGVLRIFLNELLQYGVYEQLDDFMAGYLDAPDMESFLNVVLKRVEGDFGDKTVSDFLNILRLSFYGMREEDLVDFLKLKPVEWAALFNALEEFVEVSGGRMRLKPGIFTDAVVSRYPLDESEEKRMREGVLNYAQKQFKNLSRQAKKAMVAEEGRLVMLVAALTGIKNLNDSLAPRISVCYAEIVRQLIAMRQFRKVVPWLKVTLFFNGGPHHRDIYGDLHILKENNVRLSGVVTFRTLMLALLMDDNILLVYIKVIVGGFGTAEDVRTVNNMIRSLPVSRRAKKKMLDFWNDTEETVDFIDLWDENNLEDSIDRLLGRNTELPIISNAETIRNIHEKLLRTVANLQENELEKVYGGLLYCDLAITSARLGDFNGAERYINLSRKCQNVPMGYSEFAKLYADCLNPKTDKWEKKKDYDRFLGEIQGSLGAKCNMEYLAESIVSPEDRQRIKENVGEAYQRMKSGDKLIGNAAEAIGNILYALEYWEGAMTAYEEYGRLAEEESGKAYASYRAGYAAFQLNDFGKAVEFLELNLQHIRTFRNLKNFDENITSWYLFKSYFGCGRIEEGIATAEEMISSRIKANDSKDAIATDYNALAVGLSKIAGQYSGEEHVANLDKIIKYFRLAHDYEPEDRIIRYNLINSCLSRHSLRAKPDNEYGKYVALMEELYQVNIKENDAEQVQFCAKDLAGAYYKLGRWEDAVEMVEKHGGNDFLTQYEYLRAKIMTGQPEHRASVKDMIVRFMSTRAIEDKDHIWMQLKRHMGTISEYVTDFGIEDDVVVNAENYLVNKENYESIIVCSNYMAVSAGSEKFAVLGHKMLSEYLSEFSVGEQRLRLIARFLLLPECDMASQEMIDAKFTELQRFFEENVASAEEFEIRKLENINLFDLRKTQVMADFVKKLSGAPWRDRVLIKVMERLYRTTWIDQYFNSYFELLSPLLKKGMVSDEVLRKLEEILDYVSNSEFGRDASELLYPMYVDAGLEPSATSVLFYMEHLDETQDIDAVIRFYEDNDAGNRYGLEYSYAILLRCASRQEEAEAIVDRNLQNNGETYKYWVIEKLRLCRGRGEIRKAADYFLTIPENDIDEEFISNTNFWVVASVFTYAGMHEKALAYLEMAMDDGGDYESGYPEYDPETYGDAELGVLLTEGEMDLYFDVLLLSVIYFRMGNEKLGFEVFRTWDTVTDKLIERNANEIDLVSLREFELARLMSRKGDKEQAQAHYRKACMLVDKAPRISFCHVVKEQFDNERF